ncbi:MAG: translocation/assembly module TamB domain-containing protein [Deltaproteobacteria bacterium]|nr:translocation/assembly module TamB domain-containing protein [Deltaproteobacteria bacterium]
MKKRLLIISLLGFSSLLLAALSLLVWLSCSLSGSRCLLTLCTQLTPVQIKATVIRPLMQGLQAENVQLNWPEGGLTLTRLALDWQPQALFDRRLHLDLVHLEGLKLHLNPSVQTPAARPALKIAPLTFPALPKLPVAIELVRLELDGLGLEQAPAATQAEAVTLQLCSLTGGFTCRNDRLELQMKFAGARTASLPEQNLNGELNGIWQGRQLDLSRLTLDGRAFHLEGRGRPEQRLEIALAVDDLGQILSHSRGALHLSGWLACNRELGPCCALEGSFQHIIVAESRADEGDFAFHWPGGERPGRLEFKAKTLAHNQLTLNNLQFLLTGQTEQHELTLTTDWMESNHLTLQAAGGWRNGIWNGELQQLAGSEEHLGNWHLQKTTTLAAGPEKLELGDFLLTGEQGWQLQGRIKAAPQTARYQSELAWQNFSLALLQPLTEPLQLDGQLDGRLRLESRDLNHLFCDLQLHGNPSFTQAGRTLAFSRTSLKAIWNENGLQGEAVLNPAIGGAINARLHSPDPGHPGWPEPCSVNLDWSDLPLARIAAWFQPQENFSGRWQGALQGVWPHHSGPFTMSGHSWIEEGKLSWKSQENRLSATLEKAEVNFDWQAEQSHAEIDILLADKGRLNGLLTLPLPASLPLAWKDDLPLTGKLAFTFDELGMASLLFPEMVDEVRGRLSGELQVEGEVTKPNLRGSFALEKAGGSIPKAGLHIEDLSLQGRFDHNRLKLTRLHLNSGGGELNGGGEVELEGWLPAKWNLALKGEKVLLIDLPELSLRISPDLQLEGTLAGTAVSGTIAVPEMLLTGIANPPLTASPDVVLVEKTQKNAPPPAKVKLTVNTDITLGKSVVIKAQGLDARLEGKLKLKNDAQEHYLADGEIRIAQGSYAAYGLRLPISRGRLFFVGGVVEEPVLDILAERIIGEIKAGILVSGTPRQPQVRLVSTPTMTDTEILSYIVLGHPYDKAGGESSALMLAANALLARGESAALQEELKRYLGIDVLKVEGGGGNVEEAMITVGKYLTPKLYLSFGQSLFSAVNLATLRYRMSEKWEVESQFGTVSGADIFYKLEFR